MARRFAKAAITRDLSRSDMKPVKGKMLGKMSTVTVGNLDARRRRFVRVKRKGANGEIDFLVDHRNHTVACVVNGNVINLLATKPKRRRTSTAAVVTVNRRRVRSVRTSHHHNWGLFGQNVTYLLLTAMLAWTISDGAAKGIHAVQAAIDTFGKHGNGFAEQMRLLFGQVGADVKDIAGQAGHQAVQVAENVVQAAFLAGAWDIANNVLTTIFFSTHGAVAINLVRRIAGM